VSSHSIHVLPSTRTDYDIVVCGAGCAGLCAALAAARLGAKVLLIERSGFAGGIITNVGLSYFDGIADALTDRIVLRGLPLEFLSRLGICNENATHLDQVDPDRAVYKAGAITIRNLEEFKILADRMMKECSTTLDVLYHSLVCDAELVEGRVRKITVANKNGLVRISSRVYIDCTGDADLARFSGVGIVGAGDLMPMTLHFRIGQVQNSSRLREAVRREVLAAHAAGELELFYGPHFGYLFGRDEITIHSVRVKGNGADAWDLSRAETQGRSDAWTMFERWKRNIPEFKDAYFLLSGPQIGVRESYRILGQATLSETDIMERRQYDDGVATGTWYMDVHPNETTLDSANSVPAVWPGTYDIRYGTLLPPDASNLLVAGRCHSASRAAASSSRVTCTAMAMGQAAGVAAYLAVKQKRDPLSLPGQLVRQKLEELAVWPKNDPPIQSTRVCAPL